MHIVIKMANGAQTMYTCLQLLREAKALAKVHGERYVRHWVEIKEDGFTRMRVETKRSDGLGNVLDFVI